MPQPSTTLCKLQRGAFRVTAQPVCHQGIYSFDVTVTDMDVEVTVNYPWPWFCGKRRLSVQDLGWAFYSIMCQAHQGKFPDDRLDMEARRRHADYRRIRSQVLEMDIAGDDIPDIRDELRARYDLTKYELNRTRASIDSMPSGWKDSPRYVFGVDVGFPGDHVARAIMQKSYDMRFVCIDEAKEISEEDVNRITKHFTEVTDNG